MYEKSFGLKARPFLAAGVPDVLLTLWDIPDVPTVDVMVAFHRATVRGADAAEALAEAQRAAIKENRSGPPWWSAFIMISRS